MTKEKTNMKGISMSDNQVSEMRVSVIENLVKQLLNKVKVLEDILKKNEIDTTKPMTKLMRL